MEGSSTFGRLGLEGFLLFVYSNLFTSGLISTWRVAESFFAKFFDFLFDNTSRCYLVFTSLFPYSCALLYIVDNGEIWLRVVITVVCASYSCSALDIS